MSTLLRLRIDAEWPAQHTRCEWALHDLRGALLQRGESEPQHWPAAQACELVLAADQCLALDAQLPKNVKRHDPKVVAYAVEDHLIGDVQDEHVVAGEALPEGRTRVWVIARARLAGVLAALRQLGVTPQRAYSEAQLAPVEADAWTVCVSGNTGYVKAADAPGYAFEVAGREPPPEIALAMQAARASGGIPSEILIHCAQDAALDPDAWQAALRVPVRRVGEYAWQSWPARAVCNLLVGEFAPPRERHAAWAPFRPAIAIGIATLVVYAAFSLGEWAWLDHRAGRLRAQSTEIFRAAFPQVQTIVDPLLQMQRLYDPLMRERGRLGETDFLPLLAAVTQALGPDAVYRSIGYEDGRLEFTVALKDRRAPERLRQALQARGLILTTGESRQTRSGHETTFSVRAGT